NWAARSLRPKAQEEKRAPPQSSFPKTQSPMSAPAPKDTREAARQPLGGASARYRCEDSQARFRTAKLKTQADPSRKWQALHRRRAPPRRQCGSANRRAYKADRLRAAWLDLWRAYPSFVNLPVCQRVAKPTGRDVDYKYGECDHQEHR